MEHRARTFKLSGAQESIPRNQFRQHIQLERNERKARNIKKYNVIYRVFGSEDVHLVNNVLVRQKSKDEIFEAFL
jgi:hypothetical protein